MNVLYIIGNGLDISLGMKTDYQSFYDYYQTLETVDPDIIQLKKTIDKDRYQTWADLEAGLGVYTNSLVSEKVFIKCLNSIKQALRRYLNEQYDKKVFRSVNNFVNDFYSPDNYLDSQVKDQYYVALNSIAALNRDYLFG